MDVEEVAPLMSSLYGENRLKALKSLSPRIKRTRKVERMSSVLSNLDETEKNRAIALLAVSWKTDPRRYRRPSNQDESISINVDRVFWSGAIAAVAILLVFFVYAELHLPSSDTPTPSVGSLLPGLLMIGFVAGTCSVIVVYILKWLWRSLASILDW